MLTKNITFSPVYHRISIKALPIVRPLQYMCFTFLNVTIVRPFNFGAIVSQ